MAGALLTALAIPASLQALGGTTAPQPAYTTTPTFDLAKLPLQFAPNAGQTDASVKMLSRAGGTSLFFRPTEVVIDMPGAQAVAMQMLGANQAAISGGQELPGKVNYMVGEQSQWRTNLPTYSDLKYQGIYSGIDMTYDGNNGQLKSTYTVAPGANPAQIQWRYSGAQSVAVEADGDLAVTVPGDAGKPATTITEKAPIAWQNIDGKHVPVSSSYKVAADGTTSFLLGTFNPNYALTIDPDITFGTFIGGTNSERWGDERVTTGIDSQGNIYVAGVTGSTDFPTVGPLQTNQPGVDVFVTKIKADGTAVLYSTYFGGNSDETVYDLAVDAAGNAYITGRDNFSTDFPTTDNAYSEDSMGGYETFLSKLSPNGSQVLYSTRYGGSGHDYAYAIGLDGNNNAYIVGQTDSDDLPTRNPAQGTFGGVKDLFVAKFNTNASGDASLIYATYLGGEGEEPYSDNPNIGVDTAGNVAIAATTFSEDYPTVNALDNTFNTVGNPDAAVTKLNTAGQFVFSTYLGHQGSDGASAAAIDSAGNVYVAGSTTSGDDFPTTPNVYKTVCGSDVFVTKYNANGSALVYSTCIGNGYVMDMAVNGNGEAYVSGHTRSETFPNINPIQDAFFGFEDSFVFKLNSTATSLPWSTFLTGTEGDGGGATSSAMGIVLDNDRNVYVAGYTSSDDFPVKNTLYPYKGGGADAFVLKIDEDLQSPICKIEFSDVPEGHTFYASIRCLACKGIIGGYPDGTFRYNNNVTRGQLSKIVANAAGYSEAVSGQMFQDVASDSPFYPFVQRLASRGHIGGYNCGGAGEPCGAGNKPYFRPNANASRGQISKIVSNAAGFTDPVAGQTFEDVPSNSPFYEWIMRLTSRNVMSGYACGSVGEPCVDPNDRPYFRPNANATRGQTAKIVANTFFPDCGARFDPAADAPAQPATGVSK